MKIPGLGEVKNTYVYIGGAAFVGIFGYAYYKNKKNQEADALVTPDADNTSATDDSEIDPNTGVPYDEETGFAGSGYGGIDPDTGVPYAYESGTGAQTTGSSSPYQTNQEWTQAAIGELVDTFGYSQAVASSAVETYLANGALPRSPTDEYMAMQTIVAELGPPPVGTFTLKQKAPTGPIVGPITPKPVTPTTPSTPSKTPTPTHTHDVTFKQFVPNSGTYTAMAERYGVFGGSGSGLYNYQFSSQARAAGRTQQAMDEIKAKGANGTPTSGGTTAIPW